MLKDILSATYSTRITISLVQFHFLRRERGRKERVGGRMKGRNKFRERIINSVTTLKCYVFI